VAIMTLAEAQKRYQNPLDSAIVKTFMDYSPLLSNAKVRDISGSALEFNREGSLPANGFRAVNGTVSANSQVVNKTTKALKIVSGLLTIDNFISATSPEVDGQELKAQVKSIALDTNKNLFKADGTGNSFEGLQTQVGASQIVSGGTSALSLKMLDELIIKTKGNNKALYMSEDLYIKMQSASRTNAIGGAVNYTPNSFGQMVLSYAGVPIFMAGEDSTGAEILGYTEGAGTNETSVYCVAHDSGYVLLQNGGLRSKQIDAEFSKSWAFDWYVTPTVYEVNGVWRLDGITNSAIVA